MAQGAWDGSSQAWDGSSQAGPGRSRPAALAALLLLPLALLGACSGEDGEPGGAARRDAGTDTGGVPPADGGRDGSGDAAPGDGGEAQADGSGGRGDALVDGGGSGDGDGGGSGDDDGGGSGDSGGGQDGGSREDGGPADGGGADQGPAGDGGPEADGELDGGEPAAPPPPLWFLHATDTHVGEQAEHGAALALFFDAVVPVVQPAAVLHTGDLVDHGAEEQQWAEYRAVVEQRAPPYPTYLEIPGNHDMKDDGVDGYLASARAALAGAGPSGQTLLDTPAGTVRIIRTNTADTSLNPANVLGYFGEAQMEELLALPDPEPRPVLTLVLGHHPMAGLERLMLLGSDLRMQRIFERFAPQAYLCGHMHLPYISWIGPVLSLQGGSLGKALLGQRSFALLAWDRGVVSARSIGWDPGQAASPVAWPLVLVTSPGSALLGGLSPAARAFAPGEPFALRALAFAPADVAQVEASLDRGDWTPLIRQQPPQLWMGTFAAPAEQGYHALEVRAVAPGGATGSDTLFFVVEP